MNSTEAGANLIVTPKDVSCTVGVNQNAFVGQPDMVKRYCPHGEVGQGTLLFAAAGGTGSILTQTVRDENWDQTKDTGTYSIERTIGATDVFG